MENDLFTESTKESSNPLLVVSLYYQRRYSDHVQYLIYTFTVSYKYSPPGYILRHPKTELIAEIIFAETK